MYSSEGSLFSLKTKANAQLYRDTVSVWPKVKAGQVSTLLPGETTQTFAVPALPVLFHR